MYHDSRIPIRKNNPNEPISTLSHLFRFYILSPKGNTFFEQENKKQSVVGYTRTRKGRPWRKNKSNLFTKWKFLLTKRKKNTARFKNTLTCCFRCQKQITEKSEKMEKHASTHAHAPFALKLVCIASIYVLRFFFFVCCCYLTFFLLFYSIR